MRRANHLRSRVRKQDRAAIGRRNAERDAGRFRHHRIGMRPLIVWPRLVRLIIGKILPTTTRKAA
jgi:hypothetical protein